MIKMKKVLFASDRYNVYILPIHYFVTVNFKIIRNTYLGLVKLKSQF